MSGTAERLKQARQAKGFDSARDAAIAHGWTVSTYTSHENGTRGIRPDQARRYARAFGVPAAWLLGLSTQYESIQAGPEDAVVMGNAAVGVWRERALDDKLPHVKRSIPSAQGGERMGRFRVRVHDESVNQFIQIGEFAICEPVDDRNALRIGALVVVERHRGDLLELSIRQITRREGDALVLSLATREARRSDPVLARPDDENITVLGVVVGRYADIAA